MVIVREHTCIYNPRINILYSLYESPALLEGSWEQEHFMCSEIEAVRDSFYLAIVSDSDNICHVALDGVV